MKHKLLKLTYIRKRDRKSLLFVISILLFSSFSDEIYLAAKHSKIDIKSHTELLVQLEEEDKGIDPEIIEQSAVNIEVKAVNSSATPLKSTTVRKKSIFKISTSQKVAVSSDTPSERKSKVVALPTNPIVDLSTIKIDPNAPNIDDLLALGIPKKVAFTWSKYTNAGGKILEKEDLNKIYGMDQEHVEKLGKHMTFAKKIKINERAKLTTINMNKATAYEFSRVSGIGPVLSERIVKFRDKLGGFHSYLQLNEVYGIEPQIVEENKDLFLIEDAPQKININTCDEDLLGSHSYCSYRVAKAIINYRKQHGNFTNASDLKKIRIINDEWVAKISPYFEY